MGCEGQLNEEEYIMQDTFKKMEEFRCPACNKLIFKYRLKGLLSLEIKCARCNKNFSRVLGEALGTNED
jgi:phage FluMu protein Com